MQTKAGHCFCSICLLELSSHPDKLTLDAVTKTKSCAWCGGIVMNKQSSASSEAMLAEIVARKVIPELLSQSKFLVGDGEPHPDESNIARLSALILGPDNAEALEHIYHLRERGISLDHLHLELLEPTALRLGELWDTDAIDFVAVTNGVARLQRIVHHFAELDHIPPYDDKRRALIMVAPGEDHSFGNQIVQRFMRAAGWDVMIMPGGNIQQVVDLVSREWLAVVGFSISGETHIERLTQTVEAIRKRSFNPHIGVMIGGAIVLDRPELVTRIGADGTAINAAAAVVLAKKLLAQALIAARLSSS